METDKKENSFKGFYSSVKKDADWKVVRETKSFDNIDSYLDFLKNKWEDLFFWTTSFFDKWWDAEKLLWKVWNLFLDTFEKSKEALIKAPDLFPEIKNAIHWIDDTLSCIPKYKENIDRWFNENHENYISNIKKELEEAKRQENKLNIEKRNNLLKQKQELENLLPEWERLNRNDKIIEIKNRIEYIKKQLNV